MWDMHVYITIVHALASLLGSPMPNMANMHLYICTLQIIFYNVFV